MSDRKVTAWFTVNGKHIPIFEGESKQDAVKRVKSIKKSGVTRKDVEDLTKKKDSLKDTNLKTQPITKEEINANKKFWDSQKQEDIERNKAEAEKLNAEKDARSKMKATTKTQSEHKQAIKDLSSDKYEDGTYDIATKKSVEFPKGFQVTFCQIGDNYSDEDYAKKVNECLKNSSDGKTYAGKFESTPEISFHWNDREKAIAYAKANNQISIWDWENMDVIPTGGTGKRK